MKGIYMYKHFYRHEKNSLYYLFHLAGIDTPPIRLRRISKFQRGKSRVAILTKEWLRKSCPKIKEAILEREAKQPYFKGKIIWINRVSKFLELYENFDKYAEEIE